MLRRRRQGGGDQAEAGDDSGYAEEDTGQPESEEPGRLASGPWDSGDDYPPADRFDCGSLLVPLREGLDVQVHLAAELGVWVAVIREDSGMQLQAFAAPKSGGLWDEIRHEIIENITTSEGRCEEAKGPFGAEVRAWVPAGVPGQPGVDGDLQPVRFLGADGPRWFLRGVLSGAAALDEAAAAPFVELYADVVVVRGNHPAPPREQLEIRLPDATMEALEAGLDESGDEPGWGLLNPFERGPEITEIR